MIPFDSKEKMNATSDGKTTVCLEILISLFLIISTLAVYWQIRNYGFVYDDNLYITKNANVRNGLSCKAVSWAFTSYYGSNWHPLTWLSHMLDCQIFGMNSGIHHLVNLFFHIINTLLLFFILKKMTGTVWQNVCVAALFALHPLHVESVVWIAERKDVLSTFFWILTMGAYIRYAKQSSLSNYFIVSGFFICSLLSKPMAVTLPCILLLLDYFPLNRIGSGIGIITEKIPLFLLSGVSCIITFIAQKAGGSVGSLTAFPIDIRLANASVSYVMYLWKTICPFRLAVFYPVAESIPLWHSIGALLCMGFISVLIIRKSKKYPYLLMGWLWYLVTLLPVIGLIQVGGQAMADRYTYIPHIGIFIMMVYGIFHTVSSRYYKATAVAATGLLLILAIITWHQIRYWKNDITLFERAIGVTENNETAHNNLGYAYIAENNIEKAIWHFSQAAVINPKSVKAHQNLGNTYAKQGILIKAAEHLTEAVRINPNASDNRYMLGNVMMRMGKFKEALPHLFHAIRLRPDDVDAHNDLGVALIQMGKIADAVRHFSIAAQLRPEDAEIRNNYKKASLMQKGKVE